MLYVGKALRLRSRVRSYFAKRTGRGPWIQKMVEESTTIEHIVTANEIEALILESNYVKKHKPRHNVLLRDDKHFPYMKLSTSEDYTPPEHRFAARRETAIPTWGPSRRRAA